MGENSGTENIATDKPPQSLFLRILDRIRAEQKLASAKRHTFYSFIALGGSLAIFLAACAAVQSEFVRTELIKILSLIISDPAEIVANWQDFGLFVIESLPVAALVGFFFSLWALLGSAKYTAKYITETISAQRKIRRQLRLN